MIAARAEAVEVGVLAALADQRWHSCCEVADMAGMLPLAVRSTLKALCDRGVVRRSLNLGWQLTTREVDAQSWAAGGGEV